MKKQSIAEWLGSTKGSGHTVSTPDFISAPINHVPNVPVGSVLHTFLENITESYNRVPSRIPLDINTPPSYERTSKSKLPSVRNNVTSNSGRRKVSKLLELSYKKKPLNYLDIYRKRTQALKNKLQKKLVIKKPIVVPVPQKEIKIPDVDSEAKKLLGNLPCRIPVWIGYDKVSVSASAKTKVRKKTKDEITTFEAAAQILQLQKQKIREKIVSRIPVKFPVKVSENNIEPQNVPLEERKKENSMIHEKSKNICKTLIPVPQNSSSTKKSLRDMKYWSLITVPFADSAKAFQKSNPNLVHEGYVQLKGHGGPKLSFDDCIFSINTNNLKKNSHLHCHKLPKPKIMSCFKTLSNPEVSSRISYGKQLAMDTYFGYRTENELSDNDPRSDLKYIKRARTRTPRNTDRTHTAKQNLKAYIENERNLRLSLSARESFCRELHKKLKKGYVVLQEKYSALSKYSEECTDVSENDLKSLLKSYAKFVFWINDFYEKGIKAIHTFEKFKNFNGESKKGPNFYHETSMEMNGKDVPGIFIPIPQLIPKSEQNKVEVNYEDTEMNYEDTEMNYEDTEMNYEDTEMNYEDTDTEMNYKSEAHSHYNEELTEELSNAIYNNFLETVLENDENKDRNESEAVAP